MEKRFGKDPNCEEMVRWLINDRGYDENTSRETIEKDSLMRVVASACNLGLEKVVDITIEILRGESRKPGWKGHYS